MRGGWELGGGECGCMREREEGWESWGGRDVCV